jgi:hypothetical protein
MLETRDFLEMIFQDNEGYICAWFYNKAYDRKQDRFYKLPGGIDELVESAAKASSKGWDCYFAPAVFSKPRRLKENVSHSNVLWADFDSGNGLPEFELQPNLIVASSTGKYHCYWNLTSSVGAQDLESHNRGLAYAFDADKSGWDANQLLRVPGTLNYKYDPPQSVVLHDLVPTSYSLSEFVGFLTGSLLTRYQHQFPGRPLASLRVWIK